MPIHAIAGHLVIILAPITALIAIAYASSLRSRPALRWPLLGGATVTAGLVVWAGEVGGALLDTVKQHGPVTEVTAASTHAKGSDGLSVAVFILLTMVLVSVLRLMRPGRTGNATRIAAVLLALSAVVVLVTTWTTLSSAMTAVWSNHPAWTGSP